MGAQMKEIVLTGFRFLFVLHGPRNICVVNDVDFLIGLNPTRETKTWLIQYVPHSSISPTPWLTLESTYTDVRRAQNHVHASFLHESVVLSSQSLAPHIPGPTLLDC